MSFHEEPPCEMCGHETVLDRREGHLVCPECGTVAQEWTCGDDPFEAKSRVTSANVREVKRRKVDRFGGMGARVASLVDHHRLGAAVTAAANNVLEVLPPDRLRDRALDVWAVIALSCELCKSCRAMTDLAALSGEPTGKLIDRCAALKSDLSSLFEDHCAVGALDQTLQAMNGVLAALYGTSATEKQRARSYVLRRCKDCADNAAFMNLTAGTRARALVLEHLTTQGAKLSRHERDAVNASSTAVRNALRKLQASPPRA